MFLFLIVSHIGTWQGRKCGNLLIRRKWGWCQLWLPCKIIYKALLGSAPFPSTVLHIFIFAWSRICNFVHLVHHFSAGLKSRNNSMKVQSLLLGNLGCIVSKIPLAVHVFSSSPSALAEKPREQVLGRNQQKNPMSQQDNKTTAVLSYIWSVWLDL